MLLRATVYGVVLSFITAAGVVAQEVRVTPGPLEKQAKQVTPENPVPRRLSSKPVDYPTEMQRIGGRGVISLQVTLDARGKVAEIRNTRAQLVQAFHLCRQNRHTRVCCSTGELRLVQVARLVPEHRQKSTAEWLQGEPTSLLSPATASCSSEPSARSWRRKRSAAGKSATASSTRRDEPLT